MSAYFVSITTIDMILSYAIENRIYARLDAASPMVCVDENNAHHFGRMLLTANALSLHARYNPPKDEMNEYRDATFGYALTLYSKPHPLAAYGCAQCLDYQSCEDDSWRTSTACDLLSRLSEHAILAAWEAEHGSRPNYPWGLDSGEAKKWENGRKPK